jgi:osmotically inducible protein OsmC
MSINVLYTAHATAVGGRNGRTRSDDGVLDVQLSIPKAMGGPGKPGATTPEDLFAAGYAACFGSACELMGTQLKLKPTSVTIQAAVGIGPKPDGGFGLKVALIATIGGLAQADAEKVVAAGHAVCPYSNAVKGNVDVTVAVKAA